jgi:hypothetical protein
MEPQTKKCEPPHQGEKSKEMDFLLAPLEEHSPADTMISAK